MENQSVGLAIIAKNEEHHLPKLLASIEGAFDQVVLVDTGSDDNTVGVFDSWCLEEESKNPEFKHTVQHFEWVNDFSKARTFADSFLTTDWTCWADCDDSIVGAHSLRRIANMQDAQIEGVIFGYNYAQHPTTGACVCHLRRERLVRRGAGTWMGRVHEAQTINGVVNAVADSDVQWVHRKVAETPELAQASNDRNLKILHQWDIDEPNNPRVVAYLGTESLIQGKTQEAKEYYLRYLTLKSHWDEERAQVIRRLCILFIQEDGDFESAQRYALEGLALLPDWPDSYITLAEVALSNNDGKKCEKWIKMAIDLGMPQTLLIINPLDYNAHPYKMYAAAMALQDRWEEAVESAQRALSHNPLDEVLQVSAQQWHFNDKRAKTARTYIMMAQQLIAHDEQLKALDLLENCVPHYATDEGSVVGMRSWLRERISWIYADEAFAVHYEEGGSKPEDFHSDEVSDEICEALPRVAYLLEDLKELV